MFFSQQRHSDFAPGPTDSTVSPALTAQSLVPAASSLRLATYNIHKGVSGFAWRNRIHDLHAGLHQINADLVFLQEVQGRNESHARRFANWPDAAQHEFLARPGAGPGVNAGWSDVAYGRNAERTQGAYVSDHGNALLSRFPLLTHENLDVSDHRYEKRGLLHCEIDWAGRRLHCICAHLGLFEASRHRQVDALVARIRAHVPDDAPLIIAGDFNDWRVRLDSKLREQLNVREVFEQHPQHTRSAAPARTFPSLFPILRLDRVYVRGFTVSAARVMHGMAWRRLSDHAPIVVDLSLKLEERK